MAVPSNVITLCFMEAFRHNSKVLERTGEVAGESPFEATVVFDTSDGGTVAVKWRMGDTEYLG